jgi:hypothetical protein
METEDQEIDTEIEAMKTVFCPLETLTTEGRFRALAYFVARYQMPFHFVEVPKEQR